MQLLVKGSDKEIHELNKIFFATFLIVSASPPSEGKKIIKKRIYRYKNYGKVNNS